MASPNLSNTLPAIGASSVQRTSYVERISPRKEMFINRMSIANLVMATRDGKLEGDVVTLRGTIFGIGKEYFYASCNACLKRITREDGVYNCSRCERTVNNPFMVFHVLIKVHDGSSSTTLVLLNKAVERFLHISARRVTSGMVPGDDSVPVELMSLLGNEFVFKLCLNKYNIRDRHEKYIVEAICTPLDTLETFYENVLPPTVSDSLPSSGGTDAYAINKRRKLMNVVAAGEEGANEANKGNQ